MGNCAYLIPSCAYKRGMCDYVGHFEDCPFHGKCSVGEDIPTVAELMRVYQESVAERRAATGQDLDPADVRRSLAMMRRLLAACGLDESAPTNAITRRVMSRFAEDLRAAGLSPASVKSGLIAVQRMTAAWMQEVFDRMDKSLSRITVPELPAPRAEFHAPDAEKIAALKLWLARTEATGSRRVFMYALLMFHFAMRNGDVDRLTWENFGTENGMHVLTYEPHKTSNRTHRVVRVQVSDVDWYLLTRFRRDAVDADYVIPGGGRHDHLRDMVNSAMRELGFDGNKGAYNLRKICADMYAARFGVDTAKAILGHQLVTGSTAHYVDGSSRIIPTIWN